MFRAENFCHRSRDPDNRNRIWLDIGNRAIVKNYSPDNLINVIQEYLSTYYTVGGIFHLNGETVSLICTINMYYIFE